MEVLCLGKFNLLREASLYTSCVVLSHTSCFTTAVVSCDGDRIVSQRYKFLRCTLPNFEAAKKMLTSKGYAWQFSRNVQVAHIAGGLRTLPLPQQLSQGKRPVNFELCKPNRCRGQHLVTAQAEQHDVNRRATLLGLGAAAAGLLTNEQASAFDGAHLRCMQSRAWHSQGSQTMV